MQGGSDPKNLTVLGLFVLMAFLSGCRPAAAPVSVSNQPVSVNGRRITKPLAEMSWTGEDGRVEKLSDLRGKVVILDFWATYCGPCREEIPHLNSLIAKYGAENLHVVGLNVGGAEDRAKIPEFVTGTRIDYQIAFPDDDLNQFIFAESSSIPQTAVFDRNGRLVKKVIGFNTAIQRELDAAVEQAIRME
ncbi:MAG: alkyl hydroperoxide reductase [Acidobacteria bacterium OLB17]|nr:MAG: alkyl hydroperoxide reductase [Acidobacteria bacterium OLB17]MCZ2391603.1 TlpA family protein disulfide reductase [Acidobacteriota bacterium]